MLKKNALAETPSPSMRWIQSTEELRLEWIKKLVKKDSKFNLIDLVKADSYGQVLIRLKENISASLRGMYILDFERYLKDYIDSGINVWCESIGDKNSLRNLRGIELKNNKGL